jgi:hypothetical protein
MTPPHVALALEDTTALLVRAEAERDLYRELFHLSLAQLRDVTISNRRLQARLRQFFDAQPLGYLDQGQRGLAA